MAAQNVHIRIPTYDPDSKVLDARSWAGQVDMARVSAGNNAGGDPNWTEQMTATNALMALRGRAAIWRENKVGEAGFDAWNTLKPIFLARWHIAADISAKASVLSSLKQTRAETVEDFRDRAVRDVRILFDDFPEPPAGAGAPVIAENTRLKQHVIQSITMTALANGFLPELKSTINSQAAATIDELMLTANRVEASHRISKRQLHVAPVEEVETLQIARKPGEKPRAVPYGPPKKSNFNGKCWWCRKVGHREAACFRKKQGLPRVAAIEEETPEQEQYEEGEEQCGYVSVDNAGALNPYGL